MDIEDKHMKHLQNLHTHSTYCDGKDTLEEMIQGAIAKGFDSIGFSGHSYMSFSPKISMSLEGTEEYKREIAALKKKYEGKIDIFCGLEFEMYSEVNDLADYDYLIGSAHYFYIDGTHVGFDRDEKTVRSVIETHFENDPMQYAAAYYELVTHLPEYGKFDILGHFDLVAKHAEAPNFLDVTSPEYLNYAYEAIDALRGKIPFFEVNTGAIARGYRTSPYPAAPIVKRLLDCGFLPVISSDCHDKTKLDCAFEDAARLLESCGAKERYILTKEGFRAVPL